ncbi:MAG: twin-arginine translocation signal domain-containing protein [Gemmatimonadota bacterium]
MSVSRRTFLASSATIGGALTLGVPSLVHALQTSAGATADGIAPRRTGAPLRILILGGTGFIGPNQVQYALDRGHSVTLFNRGVTNASLFPNVPRLIGDRNLPDGHKALEGGEWDVVIDNPTANPKWVRDAGRALKGRTKHYIFVSTISVFADLSSPVDESGLLLAPSDIDAAFDAKLYGQNKVRSEIEAKMQFGDRLTIVRPGLIVGPGDLSDRFSYWPVRIDRGGEVLAPGTPNDPVQYVDARDLSEWMIRLAESRTLGTFNATGPKLPTTIGEMLHGIKAVTTSGAQFTWVSADFLAANQVRAWSDMPVWVPPAGRTAAFARVNCQRSYDAGLTFRPLAETAAATLAWYKTRPAAEQEKARAGLAPEREKVVLTAWHASTRAAR